MTLKAIKTLLLLTVFSTAISSCGIFAQDRRLIVESNAEPDHEFLFRQGLVDFAQTFIGTKYRYAGKTPLGFDCSGFVIHIMREHQIEMAASSALQEKQGDEIKPSEAQAGDLLFFRKSKSGRVFHVAIVLANDNGALTMIHSSSQRGVVVDEIEKSSYWRKKYMTAKDVVSTRRN